MKPAPHFLALLILLSAACSSENQVGIVTQVGSVNLQDGPDAAVEGSNVGSAKAFFYHFDPSTQDVGVCDVAQTIGACSVWRCDDALYTSVSPLELIPVGDLSITGAAEDIQLDLKDDGTYSWTGTGSGNLWRTSDFLTAFVGASDRVSQMQASVVAPQPFEVTDPVPDSNEISLDSSQDLTVSWSANSSGTIYVILSPETLGSDGTTSIVTRGVECNFDATAGSGVIPGALLTQIPKPEGLRTYYFDVLSFAGGHSRVGTTYVEFRATFRALSVKASIE